MFPGGAVGVSVMGAGEGMAPVAVGPDGAGSIVTTMGGVPVPGIPGVRVIGGAPGVVAAAVSMAPKVIPGGEGQGVSVAA